MSVFAFFYTGGNRRIKRFSDERQAFASGNGFILVNNYVDIVQKKQITMPELVELNNLLADDKDHVTEFEDRYQAACAIMKLAEDRIPLETDRVFRSGAPTEDEVKQTKAERAQGKEKKGKSPGKAKQGRPANTSKLSGQKIYPSKETEEANPHTRPGAKNYESIELVRENPGITYEEYIEKGGVTRTLRNAVRLGRVTLSDT